MLGHFNLLCFRTALFVARLVLKSPESAVERIGLAKISNIFAELRKGQRDGG
jgi:hypothetical protein